MTDEAIRNRAWTSADDATMAAMRKEGRTAREIAATLGRTRVAVRRRSEALRSRAAPEPAPQQAPEPTLPPEHVGSRGRREWTPEDDERLAALRAQGLADEELAAAIGRTVGAVQMRASRLRLSGVHNVGSRKRRSPWTPERLAEARRLRAEGMTLSQIAARVASDTATVSRALQSPLSTEDSPGEGIRIGRMVPGVDRTGREVEQARAALARAEARHREALDGVLVPLREAIRLAGLVPSSEGEGDPAALLVERLRGRGVEFRRVA